MGAERELSPEWIHRWSDPQYSIINSEVIHANHIYATGRKDDSLIVSKYNLNGNVLWEREWKANQSEKYHSGHGIAGKNDEIYVVGSYSRDFQGPEYGYIIKYDIDGNLIWKRIWHDYRRISDIYIDGNDIYVAGIRWNVTLIAKIDENGNRIWEGTHNRNNYADWDPTLSAKDDHVYVTSVGGRAELIKYSSNGTYLWKRTWGDAFTVFSKSVFIYDEYVYLIGWEQYYKEKNRGLFLVKYDHEGNFIWNTSMRKNSAIEVNSMYISSDKIYIIGGMSPDNSLPWDGFIVKYNIDGELLKTKSWGNDHHQMGTHIIIWDGMVYITGISDEYDGFILKTNIKNI